MTTPGNYPTEEPQAPIELIYEMNKLVENGVISVQSAARLLEPSYIKEPELVAKIIEKLETENWTLLVAPDTDVEMISDEYNWKTELQALLVGILRNQPDMKIMVHTGDLHLLGNEWVDIQFDNETQTWVIQLEFK